VFRTQEEFNRVSKEVEDEEAKLLAQSSDHRTLEEISAEYETLQKQRYCDNSVPLRGQRNTKQEDGCASKRIADGPSRINSKKALTPEKEAVMARESKLHKLKEEALTMKGMKDEIARYNGCSVVSQFEE
jgi:hypothetical protein